MAFASGSNVLTNIIIASLIVSCCMTGALVALVLVLRARNAVARHRRKVLTQRWRDTFKTAYTGEPEPDPLPPIGKDDWFTVLQLFVQFHDIREKDRPRAHEVFPLLDSMAVRLDLDEYALAFLMRKRADDADKILGLNALGHLRDRRAANFALSLCSEEGPELSRAAAQCLLRIEPTAIGSVLTMIAQRDDWVRSRVEAMLRELDGSELDAAMSVVIDATPMEQKPRLLDYLRLVSAPAARIICKNVLDGSTDVETIAAALRSLAPLATTHDRDVALRYCRDEHPVVLLSALRILRKCVTNDDLPLLVQLVAHRDYWVRLRAAEVVVQFFGDSGLAQQFAAEHSDRYAKDAIRQALAERSLMARRRPAADRRGTAAAGAT